MTLVINNILTLPLPLPLLLPPLPLQILLSVQGGTNNCFRQGAKESGHIRTVRTGKLWRRVESYHAYVLSSNRTQ